MSVSTRRLPRVSTQEPKLAAPLRVRAYAVLAWGVVLSVLLPPIAGPGFLVVRTIFWPSGLLVLCTLTFVWPALRPLQGYFLTFLALMTGALLVDLIANHWPAYASWVKTLPVGARVILEPQYGVGLRLITVALLAMTLIGSGLNRRDLFLARSDLKARFQPNLVVRRSMPWWLVGGLLLAIAGVLTAIFMALSTTFSSGALPHALIYLPFILLAAAINAFVEEFGWRSVMLARLKPVLGSGQANWLQAGFFSLNHYYGTPGGPIGSLMVLALAWLFGKSVLETGGFTVNYATHVLVDATIFTFFVMTVV